MARTIDEQVREADTRLRERSGLGVALIALSFSDMVRLAQESAAERQFLEPLPGGTYLAGPYRYQLRRHQSSGTAVLLDRDGDVLDWLRLEDG